MAYLPPDTPTLSFCSPANDGPTRWPRPRQPFPGKTLFAATHSGTRPLGTCCRYLQNAQASSSASPALGPWVAPGVLGSPSSLTTSYLPASRDPSGLPAAKERRDRLL